MVKIVDFRSIIKDDGTEFFALVVQGGIEAVRSQETQRMYLTAKTANVPCTFSQTTCESMIGTELPGTVKKVEVEPYDYTIPSSGEMITLTHRYEYVDEVTEVIQENVAPQLEVF
jgi:hypothetical protein